MVDTQPVLGRRRQDDPTQRPVHERDEAPTASQAAGRLGRGSGHGIPPPGGIGRLCHDCVHALGGQRQRAGVPDGGPPTGRLSEADAKGFLYIAADGDDPAPGGLQHDAPDARKRVEEAPPGHCLTEIQQELGVTRAEASPASAPSPNTHAVGADEPEAPPVCSLVAPRLFVRRPQLGEDHDVLPDALLSGVPAPASQTTPDSAALALARLAVKANESLRIPEQLHTLYELLLELLRGPELQPHARRKRVEVGDAEALRNE